MRITIVSDVFPPEPLTSARSAEDIAGELTARGHAVEVVAPFPNRPTGRLVEGVRRAWRHRSERDGYRVTHTWHSLSRNARVLSRAAENLSFGVSSSLYLARMSRPDVVYMNTWPIFAQWLNTAVLARRKVPTICVVHDLYPETLFEGEAASRTLVPLTSAMRALDRQVYQRCDIVTALNETQADYLIADRQVPSDKVRVFHDWLDAGRFPVDAPREGPFRTQHHIPKDQFVAMYVGSMTRMAGLEIYIEAARHLRGRSDISILLVGDGAMRRSVEEQIDREGLDNIRLIPQLTPDRVPDTQAAADVLMLSLTPGAARHTTPSKMIFYMFSGRPVLASVEQGSPAARIVEEAGCGSVVEQGDGKELAQRIEALAGRRQALDELGKRSRAFAESQFLQSAVLPKLCDLIENTGMGRAS